MKLEMAVFPATEIIYVVKNSFQTRISSPKVPSPEETEDVGPTISGEYPK
jgi:hypothetical protein